MRCPKCHYISFDSRQRCRNCGYDFSLTVDVAGPDLPITTADTPEGPLADFTLESARPLASRAPDPASDLPLFSRAVDRQPAIAPPAPPRPPMAVRRAGPASPRERVRLPVEPTLDLGVPDAPRLHAPARVSIENQDTSSESDSGTASLVPRAAAAVIDVVLMVSIHAAVVYLTLRLCGLTVEELRVLPAIPLGAFLFMLTGGYSVIFTAAGGQTIGKMATGIRVVPTEAADVKKRGVRVGTATMRAAGCLISILAAGLGYVPALFSQDHRAFHDRLAHTRVVRA